MSMVGRHTFYLRKDLKLQKNESIKFFSPVRNMSHETLVTQVTAIFCGLPDTINNQ
jgi:hypothetical protein